jgi:hypothetical protein
MDGNLTIDRLGRSLIDLLGTIQTLEACGVDPSRRGRCEGLGASVTKVAASATAMSAIGGRSMIRQRIKAVSAQRPG